MSDEGPKEIAVAMNNRDGKNDSYNYPDNFIKTSKYTLLTFLPLNLFFQFKKISNFYFLIVMIIALIPGVSPINPATSVAPLVFVVGVALIKDGYEDFLRHQADNKANSITAHVIRKKDGVSKASNDPNDYELKDVESADVHTGDIIYILNGEEIRADVLLISSSGVESSAFIQTANLDGETNLKNRKGIEETAGLDSLEACVTADLTVFTGPPDARLLEWAGYIVLNGKKTSVGLDQFLYRSALLKNTEWAWGVVVYSGVDTKMFRNLAEKPPKSSNLDAKLNYMVLGIATVQQLLLIIMASVASSFNSKHNEDWYLHYFMEDTFEKGVLLWIFRFLSYFILMSYLVPISLFVTVELCKVAQALYMHWDTEMIMWMNEKWVTCTPNTANLNDQLADVKFIFTDKTGTLTENVMAFKEGDIIGRRIHVDDIEHSRSLMQKSDSKEAASLYFKALALCHTIQPFPDPNHEGEVIYDGASPDEIALVRTAKLHGYSLVQRFVRSIVLDVEGEGEQKYDILATLEFTPNRKMMSIIVREPDGRIVMYTKGADSFVEPRLHPEESAERLPKLNEGLKEMASLGLRTLMVCVKYISEEEFEEWQKGFLEAGMALVNRADIVDEACLKMEKDMRIVGSTAIEDKLQDKVPETLQFFLAANVVVWMLTGDKRETAVTIAATSTLADGLRDHLVHIDTLGLTSDDDKAIPIVQKQLTEVEGKIDLRDGVDGKPGDKKNVVFVIDGVAMHVAMREEVRAQFLAVSQKVNAAVCCRLTPLQKASVVNMFQVSTGLTALAVGDGANDVSMIQEGRVGVGIVGLEGAQAALAADYAVPRFKHLKRLCAVHGRYALARNSLCVTFSFYKNFILALTMFYFSFFSGNSGYSLYNGWLLSFFNISHTSIPPFFIGMFEKDAPRHMVETEAKLYADLGKGKYFSGLEITKWFVQGFIHSLIIYWVLYPTQLAFVLSDGTQLDSLVFGTLMMTCIVFLVVAKLCVHVKMWDVAEVIGMALTVFLYLLFIVVLSAPPHFLYESDFYFSAYILFGEAKFWLYIILFCMGLLIPFDLSVSMVQRQLFPDNLDVSMQKASRAAGRQ